MEPLRKRLYKAFFPPAEVEPAARAAALETAGVNMTGPYTEGTLAPTLDRVADGALRQQWRGVAAALISLRCSNIARYVSQSVVMRRTSQTESEEVDPDQIWVQLFRRPNEYMPALDCWNWAAAARDFTGEAFFLVEFGRILGAEVPIALHPVPREFGRFYPILSGTGAVVSYTYRRSDGKYFRNIDPAFILRIHRPHPTNPTRAVSLIEEMAYEIDAEHAAAVYTRDVANKQGKPDIALEMPIKPDNPDAVSRAAWSRYHLKNIRRVPLAYGGAKFREFRINQRDAQFMESRTLTVSHLHLMSGVHQGLFDKNATEANAKAALTTFSRFTVEENVIRFLAQLTFSFTRLFRAQPGALFFQPPAGIVPADKKEEAEVAKILIDASVLAPNEERRKRGLPDAAGGEEPLAAMNRVPLSALSIGT